MKYRVECRRNSNEYFDNWLGDYVEAKNTDEALDFAVQWLIDNGYDLYKNPVEFKVTRW